MKVKRQLLLYIES